MERVKTLGVAQIEIAMKIAAQDLWCIAAQGAEQKIANSDSGVDLFFLPPRDNSGFGSGAPQRQYGISGIEPRFFQR